MWYVGTSNSVDDWWSRPAGGREVLRVALPLIISTASISLMAFTDRMFLLWHSHHAMSAAFQGGLCFWALIAFPHSVAAYVNAFVAQYNGSGQYKRIGPVVWQGVFWGFALAPLYLLFAPEAGMLFRVFGHPESQVLLESRYLAILCWSVAASIACESLASFFTGREKTAVVMNVNVFCVLLNILLDWCWIFGHLGFPAWGLEGAAWATVVSQWVRFAIFLALALAADTPHDRFGLIGGCRFDFSLCRRLWWFGGASGFQVFVDAAGFTAFMMLIGGLGAREDAATVIAFTMNTLTFFPLIGTGVAVTSLVGNHLGANRPDLASRATLTALVIAVIYCGFFAILYAITPRLLLAGYASFADAATFTDIGDLTVSLLRFVALYLFLDAVAIVFASALKGAGDTLFVMFLNLVMIPILPILCGLGIAFAGLGIYWCWIVLTAWVWVISIIYAWRFYGGKWRSMRVIETSQEI